MDVNETLRKLREAVKMADSAPVMTDPITAAAILATAASELSEGFTALDEWLSRGGVLPSAWVRPHFAGTEG